MFSSLQSKSVFSYLFSLTFIQKQFSDISFGPICNQRRGTHKHLSSSPILAQSQHNQYPQAPADVCGVSSLRSDPKLAQWQIYSSESWGLTRRRKQFPRSNDCALAVTGAHLFRAMILGYCWYSLGTRNKLSPHRISHTYKIRNILQEDWDCQSPMYKLWCQEVLSLIAPHRES